MFGLHNRVIVMSGHYGSGKTNLAVNIALDLRREHERVTLCDADIVNPYFRTKDGEEMLLQAGVRLIAPEFANSNLDMPSLPPDIASIFLDAQTHAVFDVGGDDSGAVAMGQFAESLASVGYDMLLVINRHRLLTHTPESLIEYARDIEAASHLKFTGIANNSNLGAETCADTVLRSLEYADEVSRLLDLPLVITSVREELLCDELRSIPTIYPIRILKKRDWLL